MACSARPSSCAGPWPSVPTSRGCADRPSMMQCRGLSNVLLSLAILASSLMLPVQASAQDQGVQNDPQASPARVGLFVFERGRPVADLTVELREARGNTNIDGAWRSAVSAGGGRLEVRDGGVPLLALPLTLSPGES